LRDESEGVSDSRAKEHNDEGIEGSGARGNDREEVWRLRLCRGGRKGTRLTRGPRRSAGGRERKRRGIGVGPRGTDGPEEGVGPAGKRKEVEKSWAARWAGKRRKAGWLKEREGEEGV
jgi:hypothetical protein